MERTRGKRQRKASLTNFENSVSHIKFIHNDCNYVSQQPEGHSIFECSLHQLLQLICQHILIDTERQTNIFRLESEFRRKCAAKLNFFFLYFDRGMEIKTRFNTSNKLFAIFLTNMSNNSFCRNVQRFELYNAQIFAHVSQIEFSSFFQFEV